MEVIRVRNVCEAYDQGMHRIRSGGLIESSRAGDVLVMPTPVTTVYHCPTERVLFSPQRDANPFFHLLESVWMLAGGRNGRWLDTYVRDFSQRYGESDGMMHGAYGHRWRCHFSASGFELDQLLVAGEMLQRDPTTRRVVLGMWDPEADLAASKGDIPCNTHCYFRVQGGLVDLTVLCRSNDLIWGAYGANVVHMSVMGEVVAGLAGRRLGRYYQVSNNFHAYCSAIDQIDSRPRDTEETNLYLQAAELGRVITAPVCGRDPSPDRIREQATLVLRDAEALVHAGSTELRSLWMTSVVLPVYRTHALWREGRRDEAMTEALKIMSEDWRIACLAWMQRRMK